MVLSREMTCDLHFPWVICLLGRAVGRSRTDGAKGSPRLRVWMQLVREGEEIKRFLALGFE